MPHQHHTPPYILGIPAIDHAHADLLELLARLRHLTAGEFPAGCTELLSCLRHDFTQEERLMEAAGYYALELHRQEHAHVLRQLQEAIGAFEAGDPAPLRRTVLELSDWLEAHIVTMDMALAVALTKAEKSAVPA